MVEIERFAIILTAFAVSNIYQGENNDKHT